MNFVTWNVTLKLYEILFNFLPLLKLIFHFNDCQVEQLIETAWDVKKFIKVLKIYWDLLRKLK